MFSDAQLLRWQPGQAAGGPACHTALEALGAAHSTRRHGNADRRWFGRQPNQPGQPLAQPAAGRDGDHPAPRDRRRVTLADVNREFVSHRDNWPFLALAVGIAGWLAASGLHWADPLWAAIGLLLFIPQEYFTHIHLLHLPLPRTQRRYGWMYRLHYGHHDHPRRHDLMYMPLWLTLPMMAGNVLLLWAVTWAVTWGATSVLTVSAAAGVPLAALDPARAFWAAFGGALVGYLGFEWCHLLCHVPFVPQGRVWRQMRTQHLLHHFSDETRGYSVAPWSLPMDRLLRTRACDQNEPAARSASCRYLGLTAGHPWLDQARRRFAARSNGDATSSRLWLQAAGAPDRSASGVAHGTAAATTGVATAAGEE